MDDTFKSSDPQRPMEGRAIKFSEVKFRQRTLHGGEATVVMCCQLGLRSDAILVKLIYPGIWRGSWKSGIRPHLGCGCGNVPDKLGLGDTP